MSVRYFVAKQRIRSGVIGLTCSGQSPFSAVNGGDALQHPVSKDVLIEADALAEANAEGTTVESVGASMAPAKLTEMRLVVTAAMWSMMSVNRDSLMFHHSQARQPTVCYSQSWS